MKLHELNPKQGKKEVEKVQDRLEQKEAMEETMITCPSCDGSKQTLCHFNRGDQPHTWEYVQCRTCTGTGWLTESQFIKHTTPNRFRVARLLIGLGFRELGVMAKVDYAKITQIEHDIDRHPELHEQILVVLRAEAKKKIAELESKIEQLRAI